MKTITKSLIYSIFLLTLLASSQTSVNITVDTETEYQTVEGFGASLAFYDNWLTAHPNKAEIYQAIFGELSLDILRVRNAYDYDPNMIGRVVEFYNEAENSLGHPIKILSTSWGPPAYLKSNNNRKNGGTLKYTLNGNDVVFDYAGFADWWDLSLDEYNNNGIFPDYISLQNEPDYTATWESCLFNPTETINATDSIAGYDKALEAIYNKVEQRLNKPKILGPETIGIGYNRVQNYVNSLNTSYLYGIAHHLYHGVDVTDPWASTSFSALGNFQTELPYFQTEFGRGDWFSLAGLMYKSFHDENVAAYLFWDLIWKETGLVALEYPWDQSQWTTEKGYYKTKDFYAFKQYSAFIHPNWKRIDSSSDDENIKTLSFINPSLDTITMVLVNRSLTEDITVNISGSTFNFSEYSVVRTSENEDFIDLGISSNSNITLPKKSISTLIFTLDDPCPGQDASIDVDNDGIPDCIDDCLLSNQDSDSDGLNDCDDQEINSPCPLDVDANGVSNDNDNDGTPNCTDNCDDDPNKTEPGECGCGVAETDTDGDGVLDCNDQEINSPCHLDVDANGISNDDDGDGTPNCNDSCNDSIDTDGDGTPDCTDNCDNDPNKTEPGDCGCGVAETDTDGDGVVDCLDPCPNDASNTCNSNPCATGEILICHIKGNGTTQELCVSQKQLQRHLNHGDYEGPCVASAAKVAIQSKEIVSSSDLKIVPNPAKYNIAILKPEESIKTVYFYNVLGHEVKKVINNFDNISVEELETGMYFLMVETETNTYSKKLVIK